MLSRRLFDTPRQNDKRTRLRLLRKRPSVYAPDNNDRFTVSGTAFCSRWWKRPRPAENCPNTLCSAKVRARVPRRKPSTNYTRVFARYLTPCSSDEINGLKAGHLRPYTRVRIRNDPYRTNRRESLFRFLPATTSQYPISTPKPLSFSFLNNDVDICNKNFFFSKKLFSFRHRVFIDNIFEIGYEYKRVA